MASQAELEDPLYNLRQAIATNTAPTLTSSADPVTSDPQTPISQATHIQFNNRTFPLASETRFAPLDQPVNLRSIYFTWLNKDASLPDYISSVQNLNAELSGSGGAGGSVQNLAFAQKVELIAWLAGESDFSEFIKPLEGAAASAQAQDSADVAAGVKGGVGIKEGGVVGGVDQRLLEIYAGERRMGDHNSVLWGTKPTDFTSFRKTAGTFLRSRPNPNAPVPAPHANQLVSGLQKKPARRLEPIILLSPSASSLLRMSNIKDFLDQGVFHPPMETSSQSSNLLHLQRLLPTIDPHRTFRFILVDSTSNFKPDYWNRVVCVFTTGQSWQFKSYKWSNPADLFSHVLGVHVGWQGEEPPASVKDWGRGVMSVKVDKWSPVQGTQGRWRDREVVEGIWGTIEERMRRGGWGRDGPGMAGR